MAEEENLAVMLYGKLDIRMDKTPKPKPKEGEVLVGIKACGICASDVHLWILGKVDRCVATPENPFWLGHECAGEVLALGEGVTHLKPGDRVALELGLPCGECDLCKAGKSNLCKPFSSGGLTKYQVHPANYCHKLPDDMSYESGALLEPIAVAVRACRRAGVGLGSVVLVCGAGPIGLSVTMASKGMGASAICVTDINPSRLELARRFGATYTVLVTSQDVHALAQEVIDTLGVRPGHVIEASGVQSSLQMAIYAVRPGGVLVPVAIEPPEVTLPLVHASTREVDIKGTFSYCGPDYPMAVSLLSRPEVDATPMITHRFSLQEAPQALELVHSRAPGVIKVMIQCSDEDKDDKK